MDSTARATGATPIGQEADVGKWQPIETAPKDGTEILIVERNGRRRVAKWLEPWGSKGDWYVQVSTGDDHYPTIEVIGWQPLPSPPISTAGR